MPTTEDKRTLEQRLTALIPMASYPTIFHSGSAGEQTINEAIARITQLETALKPFAEFHAEAEKFVKEAASNNGSPIMPTKAFTLNDFRRAREAMEGV